MEKMIIASGAYWICENMDNLAPIIEEGTMYLLSDGSRVLIKNNETDQTKIELINSLPRATKEQRKLYASQKYGTIFKGQQVIIRRGRKYIGETKEVKGYYRYDVPGTYGHQYTEYLLFTDGTKVNILHCDVVGIEHKKIPYMGKFLICRRYEEDLNCSTFNVGGRL